MESKTPRAEMPSGSFIPSIKPEGVPEGKAPDPSEIPKATKNAEEEKEEEREGEVEEEEEEEGECGFCVFMKGGGCRDAFIAWEKCVEDAEKTKDNIVDKCFEVTGLLKTCMEQHSDYYRPILQAEKAAEEEVTKELEREKGFSSGTTDEKDASIDNKQQEAALDSKNH